MSYVACTVHAFCLYFIHLFIFFDFIMYLFMLHRFINKVNIIFIISVKVMGVLISKD